MKFAITLPVFLLAGIHFSPLLARCPTEAEVTKFLKQYTTQIPPLKSNLVTAEGDIWIASTVPNRKNFVHKYGPQYLTQVKTISAQPEANLCTYNLYYMKSAYKSSDLAKETERLVFNANPCPKIQKVLAFIKSKHNKPKVKDSFDDGADGMWEVTSAPDYATNLMYDFDREIWDLGFYPQESTEDRCAYHVDWAESARNISRGLAYYPGTIILAKIPPK